MDSESQKKKPLLAKNISDYWITLFFLFGGLILLAVSILGEWDWFWISPYRGYSLPIFIIFIYFWLKALVIDFLRIKQAGAENRTVAIRMPGFVFWAYGLQLITILVINSSIYRFYPTDIQDLLYYKYSVITWLILEIITSIIYKLKFSSQLEETKNIEYGVVGDIVRAYIIFGIYMALELVISFF